MREIGRPGSGSYCASPPGITFSWIHGLTVRTLAGMFVAVAAVRKGRVRLHAGFMVGTMNGAFVAGGFAFAPGPVIGRRFSATEAGLPAGGGGSGVGCSGGGRKEARHSPEALRPAGE